MFYVYATIWVMTDLRLEYLYIYFSCLVNCPYLLLRYLTAFVSATWGIFPSRVLPSLT